MRNQLIKNLYLSILLLSFSSALNVVGAQSQTTSQVISSTDLYIETPTIFSFPSTFFSTSDQNVQVLFDPNNTEDQFRVTDLRNSGGFNVDLRFTDLTPFVGPSISYDNISILTSSIGVDSIDRTPNTAANDVTGPLDFDWDFSSSIPSNEFTSIPFINPGASEPITIIDGTTPIGPGRVGVYSLALSLNLNIPANTTNTSYLGDLTVTLTS